MRITNETIRIPSETMKSEFIRVLKKYGFNDLKAEKCGETFTLNSLEGVYSHGINRFPAFVKNVAGGYIKPDAEPTLVHSKGSLEQWDGNLGPGPLNALFATDRAVSLAGKTGIGLVGLANTNHWQRGGTYGWHAAKKGFIMICWTNTIANMPAWGASDARLGNNPFVMALPYENEAIVLDFSMTQYSYGKMETYMSEGKKLPYAGGFDNMGTLTDDPAEIIRTQRALSIGFWKGSGFSFLLDILASLLSGGLSTHEISKNKIEHIVSQVFISINPRNLYNFPSIDETIRDIIADLKKSMPSGDASLIRYPGENILRIRSDNQKKGIPVKAELWDQIVNL